MVISEITLSYPCVKYNVEVSHFTARKSTAIEWVILEAISKVESLPDYAGVPIASFFEHVFTINDADLLLRPCIMSLHDMGAISMTGIDDETELSTVPMRNLSLTPSGKEMQQQGLLPGVTAEDTFQIYYDVALDALIQGASIYKDEYTGLQVLGVSDVEEITFPMSTVKEWINERQKDKKRAMVWLSPTTQIQDIEAIESTLLWKNVARKIDLGPGMKWTVVGNENTEIDEVSLINSEIGCPEQYENLPYAEIVDPDKEIDEIVSVDGINTLIKGFMMKDELFCVLNQYYAELPQSQLNQKKRIRIGVVFGSEEFAVKSGSKQIIIHIPEKDMFHDSVYLTTNKTLKIGRFNVKAGTSNKDIVLAYSPKNTKTDIASILVSIVDKYVYVDDSLLFVLHELGLKELMLEYVSKLVGNMNSIQEKSEIIEGINSRSIKYYNQKIISAVDTERLLVNDAYIIEKSKSVGGAREVLNEYGKINSFRQNENLFQRILKLVLENMPAQKKLEDVWNIWKEIQGIKKSYIQWINKNGLYKNLYSKHCIDEFVKRFRDDNIFEIEEYTLVEQIILNMRRITIRLQDMLPEINLFESCSEERAREVVLLHREEGLNDIYDEVRKWRDEEERFTSRIIDVNEYNLQDNVISVVSGTIAKLSSALAVFFDDSFMRYNKVYIVDTCTLMDEPSLISWFDDSKALLVIPMMVLQELDGLKTSEDEDKAFHAREAIRLINNYKSYDWFNDSAISHPELLPTDLDPNSNDNKILSIAIQCSAKSPVLLSNDINMRNIAEANNIQTMDLDAYQSMKEHERMMSANKKSGKKNKKKKK